MQYRLRTLVLTVPLWVAVFACGLGYAIAHPHAAMMVFYPFSLMFGPLVGYAAAKAFRVSRMKKELFLIAGGLCSLALFTGLTLWFMLGLLI